jgi:two-component system NtrC family sensor kinase
MSFSLKDFDLAEMLRCGLDLRRETRECGTMEDTAGSIVRYFHDAFRDPKTGEPECALVRFYKTHPFGGLEGELQSFATQLLDGHKPSDAMKCLVLLATAGQEAAWNSRHLSRGHRAIPLPSVGMVEQAPMIAQLVRQLGLDIEQVVEPRADVVGELGGKTYNVFYVPHALGSPAIPAQDDFVRKYGIRSVIGCGGIHLTGDLYAAILFSKVEISPESADRFRNIALDLKLCISPFRDDRVFASAAAAV